jgi:hypothetical protein
MSPRWTSDGPPPAHRRYRWEPLATGTSNRPSLAASREGFEAGDGATAAGLAGVESKAAAPRRRAHAAERRSARYTGMNVKRVWTVAIAAAGAVVLAVFLARVPGFAPERHPMGELTPLVMVSRQDMQHEPVVIDVRVAPLADSTSLEFTVVVKSRSGEPIDGRGRLVLIAPGGQVAQCPIAATSDGTQRVYTFLVDASYTESSDFTFTLNARKGVNARRGYAMQLRDYVHSQ